MTGHMQSAGRVHGQWPVLLLLLVAALLRLWLPSAIEFKRDEQEALNLGMRLIEERPWSSANPWPRHGMLSSQGVANAPLFTWVMALLWMLTRHPVGATALIAVINTASLYPLWLWAKRRFGESSALLTLALMAVSPFAVLFSRKLWAQDLLLAGLVVLIWGVEWLRERPWRGLILLGLAAVFVGQLHQSGAIAMALLPVAITVQLIADRWRGATPVRLGKPSAAEAVALVGVIALNAFFWITYATYFVNVPTEAFVNRPKLASYSFSLLRESAYQIVPQALFYFFDRHDFLRNDIRHVLYHASLVLGAPLLVYGVWRWFRAPLTIPVLGIWWWAIIGVFAIARIPTYPFYVLVLAPLPALLAAGVFDAPMRGWIATALALWRWTYVCVLATLTVTTYLWVAERGDGGGDFGVTYAVREAQARAVLAHAVTRSQESNHPILAENSVPNARCDQLPIEVQWIVRWLDAKAEPPATLRLCEGWQQYGGTLRYVWTLRDSGGR